MSTVPDVGGRDLSPKIAAPVETLKLGVDAQRDLNAEKVRRLAALDQMPNPMVEFGLRLESLIDTLLGDKDGEKRLAFELRYQTDRATLLDLMLEQNAPSKLQVVTK